MTLNREWRRNLHLSRGAARNVEFPLRAQAIRVRIQTEMESEVCLAQII